jgi:hypothetical protein
MEIKEHVVSLQYRLEIGEDRDAGKYFLSIPVSNPYADYTEYYEISKEEYDKFTNDLDKALEFSNRARRREVDQRLLIQPGRFRGDPWPPLSGDGTPMDY